MLGNRLREDLLIRKTLESQIARWTTSYPRFCSQATTLCDTPMSARNTII